MVILKTKTIENVVKDLVNEYLQHPQDEFKKDRLEYLTELLGTIEIPTNMGKIDTIVLSKEQCMRYRMYINMNTKCHLLSTVQTVRDRVKLGNQDVMLDLIKIPNMLNNYNYMIGANYDLKHTNDLWIDGDLTLEWEVEENK